MTKTVKSVVVVGGGAAGWITATRIAAKHISSKYNGLKVTLIESPEIKTIGVGEGTWPTMRNTLAKIGISETEFLRECNGAFKQGAKFARWVDGSDTDFYYHPLMLPQGFSQLNLAPYWLKGHDAKDLSFSNAVCFQEQVCEQGLAPKMITTPEYASVANYAYHLDARKFTELLTKHGKNKLGVRHILDDVVAVNVDEKGDIVSLGTKFSGELEGDLFVDCSGFKSLLIGEHYKVPLINKNDVLFVDNALAVQVPYEQENSPIACHTISTAQQAGWVWDIGLYNRRGVGYVYSSSHTSHEGAENTLRQYVGAEFDKLDVKRIPINSGHREVFWVNNCVAVGLSAGFLEPLEASALVLVEMAAEMISEQLPACREVMDITAKRYNQVFNYRWERIIDFLKLHYVLSKRTDNDFWQDNRDPGSMPESLEELLTLWRYQFPGDQDFSSNNEVFPAASYLYVLYGMGFKTEYKYFEHTLGQQQLADELFANHQKTVERALVSLPDHRALLDKVRKYGFQSI